MYQRKQSISIVRIRTDQWTNLITIVFLLLSRRQQRRQIRVLREVIGHVVVARSPNIDHVIDVTRDVTRLIHFLEFRWIEFTFFRQFFRADRWIRGIALLRWHRGRGWLFQNRFIFDRGTAPAPGRSVSPAFVVHLGMCSQHVDPSTMLCETSHWIRSIRYQLKY